MVRHKQSRPKRCKLSGRKRRLVCHDTLLDILRFLGRADFYFVSWTCRLLAALSDQYIERFPPAVVPPLCIDGEYDGNGKLLKNTLWKLSANGTKEKLIPFADRTPTDDEVDTIWHILIKAPLKKKALTFLKCCRPALRRQSVFLNRVSTHRVPEVTFNSSYDKFVEQNETSSVQKFWSIFTKCRKIQMDMPKDLHTFGQHLALTECRSVDIFKLDIIKDMDKIFELAHRDCIPAVPNAERLFLGFDDVSNVHGIEALAEKCKEAFLQATTPKYYDICFSGLPDHHEIEQQLRNERTGERLIFSWWDEDGVCMIKRERAPTPGERQRQYATPSCVMFPQIEIDMDQM